MNNKRILNLDVIANFSYATNTGQIANIIIHSRNFEVSPFVYGVSYHSDRWWSCCEAINGMFRADILAHDSHESEDMLYEEDHHRMLLD